MTDADEYSLREKRSKGECERERECERESWRESEKELERDERE